MAEQMEIDIDGFGKRRLSRYLPFFRFAYLLKHGLYIPNATAFSDRWEGLLGVKGRLRLPEKMKPRFTMEDYQRALQWIHVSCWYDGVQENFLMWKAYGVSGEAIMVESSVARLEKVYRDSTELHVGYLAEVKYCAPNNEPAQIRIPSLIAPWGATRPVSKPGVPDLIDFLPEMFIKYDHYEGENEYRLVCLNKRYSETRAEPSSGIVLSFEQPQLLIEKVRVAPLAPEIVFETVSLLVETYAPGVPVERSKIEINA